MTFWKIIRTRKIILKITTLLSRSKCIKLANRLPIGKLHSTAKVTMWLLPCLMFGTTPSESHHADRTGFLRLFRWGNKWSICSRSQREWVRSPASSSGSRAGFIYSSPHTQGRVEYRRQDSSYNQARLCDESMWWKLLHNGLQGALGLLYTYIHIMGGRVPFPHSWPWVSLISYSLVSGVASLIMGVQWAIPASLDLELQVTTQDLQLASQVRQSFGTEPSTCGTGLYSTYQNWAEPQNPLHTHSMLTAPVVIT